VLIVVALGGNALLRRGEPLTAEVQQHNVEVAATAVAQLAREHQIVVTHGNGPQVGLLALQSASCAGTPALPFDVLDAESEGMIGYLLDQAIGNRLPEREVATLLTQVIVDPEDPAFDRPTKPVGPTYDEPTARQLAADHGWTVARDGSGWRRVIASPVPREIVELSTIETLIESNVVVICTGGGGIPVRLDERGALHGVEAVVDKDAASALLAELLGADLLLLLTDVSGVSTGWGTRDQHLVRRAGPDALDPEQFAAGSMRPKLEAACRFVRNTGRDAAIGRLHDAAAIVAGEAGTRVSLLAERVELDDAASLGAG
jgi:carbamate kinase